MQRTRLAAAALLMLAGIAGATPAAVRAAPATSAAGSSGARATAVAATPQTPASPRGEGEEPVLARHAQTIERLRHSLEAVLGPMPAVATTPFFGLAALSAVALASDTELARRSTNPIVRACLDNDLVREARRYARWPVLATFLALALLTYVANSGKVRGIAGKGLRLIEDGSSFLLYSALATGALAAAAPPSAAATAARTMGIVDLSWQALTACGLAVGLAAMMISRYALDFLIWLMPVPFIDFCFETLKKLLAVSFIALYVFAPGAAALLALLLVAGALFASGWALRILGFAFHIVLRPWMARLDPAFAPRLVEPRLLARHVRRGSAAAAEPQLATWAVALRAPGLRQRQGGTLLAEAGAISFVSRGWFGRRRRRSLTAAGDSRELVRTLLWIELRLTHPPGAMPASLDDRRDRRGGRGGRVGRAGRTGQVGGGAGSTERFAISRAHDFTRLCRLLDARDGGRSGAAKLIYREAGAVAAAPQPTGR